MAKDQFSIPEEYKSQLRYVETKDKRSDAEILDRLTQHAPITSEKNIWTYWHSGVKSMPSWCQRNIINWVRLHGPDWTVRVLDTVPDSPNHALTWIAPEELPEAFVKGTMRGPYVGPHSADFLRGAALYAYGGVWMDVGNILFRNLDKVCWDQLADENSPYTVSTPWMFEQYTANHFVASRKGDIFIKKWHELFVHLWKGRTDFTEPNGGFDGVDYWAKKILLFDVGPEDFAAEQMLGYNGEDLLKVFATRRDADPGSEEYKKAEQTTWRLLTKSTMQKITHGKGLTHSPHCGALLELPENEGKDTEPGTFGELLRYGSVHFEQTRESIVYVSEPPCVEPDLIIHKGLLEA